MNKFTNIPVLLSLVLILLVTSCSRLGYGVLLWSIDDPPIDSGTVLPVYIRSNIERKWVVGLPESVRGNRDYKMEIPLSQLEFIGSERKAIKWAEEFSQHALLYAETMHDGLPIRRNPDNNARREYRLRLGEIIKILDLEEGVPPIGPTGDPLPGDWYKVMTHDGVIGFCFSYRLRIFNQNEEPVHLFSSTQREHVADPLLESVLTKKWSPESYLQMVNLRRINIQHMERKYRFDPGHEIGIARIILPNLERQFSYGRIISEGERSWSFYGTTLQMTLRQNNTLAVQFTDEDGTRHAYLFASLPTDVDDILLQEKARRESQYLTIHNLGPIYSSNNYGTITLLRTGGFTWTGYDLLVPHIIPAETKGTGQINMDLYISPFLSDRYNGAFSLQFNDVRDYTLYFLYGFSNQGLNLEIVPVSNIDDITVTQRAASPVVLYFYRDSSP
ncbi:MAG: SH3 domain-containing protein [Treponema sp.]|nr:SH3 domain-containing protein [Treponema sp.]